MALEYFTTGGGQHREIIHKLKAGFFLSSAYAETAITDLGPFVQTGRDTLEALALVNTKPMVLELPDPHSHPRHIATWEDQVQHAVDSMDQVKREGLSAWNELLSIPVLLDTTPFTAIAHSRVQDQRERIYGTMFTGYTHGILDHVPEGKVTPKYMSEVLFGLLPEYLAKIYRLHIPPNAIGTDIKFCAEGNSNLLRLFVYNPLKLPKRSGFLEFHNGTSLELVRGALSGFIENLQDHEMFLNREQVEMMQIAIETRRGTYWPVVSSLADQTTRIIMDSLAWPR